jgi:very-short-patch-repair endonuclease
MNTATPSLRATPSEEGELIPNAENSPSFEGVARSDGVADFMTLDGVAAANANPKLKQLPYNPALKQRAKELRKAGNLSETLFWSAVKNKQLNGLDFDRQRVIGNYIVDFYCHELALVVEIDGSSHDDKQEYDLARDQYLEALGLKVLHVQDINVKQNLEDVVELVRHQLQPSHP